MVSFQEFKRDVLDELEDAASAMATLKGAAIYPDISGVIRIFETTEGVIVVADVKGLPAQAECGGVFGFHIHEGMGCGGDMFAETLGHYNPANCLHPYHAGDLPPLFSNRGEAWMAVWTDRFTVQEVIGRTVVIHLQSDDFMTQPSGNSGMKIACGVIRRV